MNEIAVVSKVEFSTLKNSKLAAACRRIEKATEQTRNALFRIAYELHRIDANKLYTDDGYKNISDAALALFGYKKAMTNNLCRIAERYLSATSPVCVLSSGIDGDGVPIEKPWTVGQLQEVLTLSTDEVKALVDNGTLNANMTSKAIREAVKKYKAERDGKTTEKEAPALPPVDETDDCNGADACDIPATDAPQENDLQKAIDAARKALEKLLSMVTDEVKTETIQTMLDDMASLDCD